MKKTFWMLMLGSLLLPAAAFAAPPTPAQSPVQTPAQAPKAVQAPTQSPAQGPTKTAQADSGYRTYSYQPGTTTTNYYRRNTRGNNFFSGFYSAGWKVNGDYWAK